MALKSLCMSYMIYLLKNQVGNHSITMQYMLLKTIFGDIFVLLFHWLLALFYIFPADRLKRYINYWTGTSLYCHFNIKHCFYPMFRCVWISSLCPRFGSEGICLSRDTHSCFNSCFAMQLVNKNVSSFNGIISVYLFYLHITYK